MGQATGDFDRTAPQAAELRELRAEPLGIRDLTAGIANELLPCSCQFHATRSAFEDWRADFLLPAVDVIVSGCGKMRATIDDNAVPGDLASMVCQPENRIGNILGDGHGLECCCRL